MERKYRLYQIDSFTKKKLSGNPAGVITNADGLSSGEMQRIARELNNSETAFIFKSDNSESDVNIRFLRLLMRSLSVDMRRLLPTMLVQLKIV